MLKESFWLTTGYNLVICQQAGGILLALNRDGIPVIVLKGLSLAESIYPHIGMRPMADIDLLVRERDLALASRRLAESGYKLKPANSGRLYVKDGGIPICVDLHIEIPYLKEEEIWATARPIKINGGKAATLSIEQNIIYLCYHLVGRHGYPYKRWLEDIHLFITYYKKEIIWQELIKKIKAYQLDMPCYWCFLKAKEVFQTPIPDNVFSYLKPANSLKSKIFKRAFQNKRPIPFVGYLLGMSIHSPRHIFSIIFPSLKFLQLRYNMKPPGVYFCYILRPILLFIKAAKGIWGLILR